MTSAVRRRPARSLRRRAIGLQHVGRLEPGYEEGRIKAAQHAYQHRYSDGRQKDSVGPKVAKRDPGIEEGGERTHEQLDEGQRDQHRNRADQQRLADKLDDELLAVRAEHLAQRDFAGALPGPRRGEIGEVHDRHAEDQQRDHREGRDRPLVVARRHRGILRLAQVDVLDVDEMPLLVVALVGADTVVGFIGDVALFPGRQRGFELLRVGAGSQIQIDPTRLPTP